MFFGVSQNIQKVTVARHKLVFEHIHLYGIHIHIIYIPIGFTLDGLVVNHLPNLFWGITASQVKEFHDKAVPRFSYIPGFLRFIMTEVLKNSCRATAEVAKSDREVSGFELDGDVF